MALLLLATPGLLFELLRERSRPGRDQSGFREIAVVVVSSTALNTVAFVILWAIQSRTRHLVPDPERLISEGTVYARDHVADVAVGLALQVLLACAIAFAIHCILCWRFPEGNYRGATQWHELTVGRANPGKRFQYVTVELHDGTRWTGYWKGHEASSEGALVSVALSRGPSNRDLARYDPHVEEPVNLGSDWGYVALAGSDIKSILFSYVPD